MLTIRNEKFIRFEGGKSVVMAEIDVDTLAELPTADAIEGRTLHQGSTALIITESKLADGVCPFLSILIGILLN